MVFDQCELKCPEKKQLHVENSIDGVCDWDIMIMKSCGAAGPETK